MKLATGLLALLFFVYSITVWVDKSVIAGDTDGKSKNSNYVIGIIYTMISLGLGYLAFF